MKYLPAIFVVLALGLIAVPRMNIDFSFMQTTSDVVAPANIYGFDKVVPTTLAGNKVLAAELSGLCEGMADRISSDGKLPDPNLKTLNDVKNLRYRMLELLLDGKKVNDTCPQFAVAIEPIFQKELPDAAKELSPELRAKAADMFHSLAYACSKGM
jgi:hypothetical protein